MWLSVQVKIGSDLTLVELNGTEHDISVKMLDHYEDLFGYFLSSLVLPIPGCFIHIYDFKI